MSAGPGSTSAPSGLRNAFNVLARKGPAVTCDQSVTSPPLPSSVIGAPASMRMASAKDRPLSAARVSASLNCRIARSRRSRSTSTHWPRNQTSASVPASSAAMSSSVSGSPSSVTSTWKSSSPSRPVADGVAAPIVAVTLGRAGRLARQVAGMRTMTPALSSSGALARNRDASPTPQRRGWNISPASTIAFSQPQVSAARCTGTSSDNNLSRFAAPEYSLNACPSGTCWAVAFADSPVV